MTPTISLQKVAVASFTALVLSALLSPAYLVHDTDALTCNLFGCSSRQVKGRCHKDFELVRRVFHENLQKRGESGGGIAVYFRGELVVDLWGGEWEQFSRGKVRSYGGLGGVVMGLLVEDGVVSAGDRVGDLWPEFVTWVGGHDVTVGDVMTGSFNLSTEHRTNHLRASQGKTQATARTTIRRTKTPTSYHPYFTDVVVAHLVPIIDPLHRTLERFIADRIVTKLGVDPESLVWDYHAGVKPALPSWVPSFARSVTNFTDSWCGPLPLRGLWSSKPEDRPGLENYLMYKNEFLGKTGPMLDVTAASLGKIYAAIAADYPGAKDMGYDKAATLFSTESGPNCLSLHPTPESRFSTDEFGRNISRSECGFILSTEAEPIFALKEALTHGRRWMHFGWSGLGGSYAAVSVGHDISVVYLTNREGLYEKDPRVNGVLEAVNEVVYWKEMAEFAKDLKEKGLVGGEDVPGEGGAGGYPMMGGTGGYPPMGTVEAEE